MSDAATKSPRKRKAPAMTGGPSPKLIVAGREVVRNPKAGLLAMPDEILLIILTRVRDKVTNYANIRATCFRFRTLVNTTDFFRAHWAFWFGGDALEIERRHVLAFARAKAADAGRKHAGEDDETARPTRVPVDAARLARVDKGREHLDHRDYEAILRDHVKGWVRAMGRHYPFFSPSLKGGLVAGRKKYDEKRRMDIDLDLLEKLGVVYEMSARRLLPGSRSRWRIDRTFEAAVVHQLGAMLGYRVVVERAAAKLARYGAIDKLAVEVDPGDWIVLDCVPTPDLPFFAASVFDAEGVASLAVGIPPPGTNMEDLLRTGRFDLADRMLAPIPKETVAKALSGRAAWAALGSGDPTAVDWLMDRGADLVVRSDDPPLMWACREADVVMLDALLDRLALPSEPDQSEMLTLAIDDAVRTRDTRKVESLLRRGVDPNSRVDKRKHPLDWVVRRAQSAPDRLLFQTPRGKQKTTCARLVEILLRAGADTGVLFEKGPDAFDTPRIQDATRDVSLLRTLLSPRSSPDGGGAGAPWVDPWRGFERGCSLVQIILPRRCTSEDTFNWFVECAGVQKGEGPRGIDRKDARGDTVLLEAVRAGDRRRVRELLDMGAMPNGVAGSTFPLSEAARLNCCYVLEELMKCDVDPDGPPSDAIGRGLPPPLVLASMNLNTLCVHTLLKGGAKPNLRGPDGWSPFWACLFARKRVHEEKTTWIALGGDPDFRYAEKSETDVCALLLAFDADPFLAPGGQDPLRLYRAVDVVRATRIVAKAEKYRRDRPFRDRRVHEGAFRRRCRILCDKTGQRRVLKPEDADLHQRWYAEIKGELDLDDDDDE